MTLRMNIARCVLTLVGLASITFSPGPSVAQSSWALAAPGYEKVPTQYRQVPGHVRKTAGVLGIAGLPQLQEVSVPRDHLELRVWVVHLGIPYRLLRLVRTEAGVVGEMFGWWSVPGPTQMEEYLGGLSGQFGCMVSEGLSEARIDRLQSDIVENGICRVDFRSAEPEWARLLATLEDARVVELPDQRSIPLVFDGSTLWVDVLEGARFRSYEYLNPDAQSGSDSENAQRILNLVESVFPA